MQNYDVVVIGAGIHGAGVLQACAAQGWSCAVIERHAEPAQETSRYSSKLIHGGLRYLETAQFKLVHECLRERATLLQNAPDLVRMVPFYIPVYRSGRRHPFWIAMGLTLYNLLAYLSGGKKQGVRLGWQRLAQAHWPELGLRTEDIRCVFQYLDAQTDDAQLTREVLKSAYHLGADSIFDTTPVSINSTPEGFQLSLSNGRHIRAKHVINATGPWVNEVAALLAEAPFTALDWVQGTHIILPRPSLSGCLYFEAPQDGRAMFVLPWYGQTMVGTTERILSQPAAEATQAEQDYLLHAYNHYFPEYQFESADIVSAFAGIRVLPKGKPGAPAHRRPRETVYATHTFDCGPTKSVYVGIYGGKLTSYRATADAVLKHICDASDLQFDASKSTRYIKLNLSGDLS